jgi:hypothetical protein
MQAHVPAKKPDKHKDKDVEMLFGDEDAWND